MKLPSVSLIFIAVYSLPGFLRTGMGLVLALLFVTPPTECEADELESVTNDIWVPTIHIPLDDHTNRIPDLGMGIEFSTDSKYVAVWGNRCTIGYAERRPRYCVVYSASGQNVRQATDTNGVLTTDYADIFPAIALRSSRMGFVTNSTYCEVSKSANIIFRVEKGILETWKCILSTNLLVRSMALPKSNQSSMASPEICAIELFENEGEVKMVLGYWGEAGMIVSLGKDQTVETIPYGHIETDEEAIAYGKKHRLGSEGSGLDSALYFSGDHIAICPEKKLLACGTMDGKRVRVISLCKPYTVLKELNGKIPPNEPKGGLWGVQRVEFASGKYLIIEYQFAGRRTQKVFQPTEIYDVQSWKLVWKEDDLHISNVAISPDGSRLAYIETKHGRGHLIICICRDSVGKK